MIQRARTDAAGSVRLSQLQITNIALRGVMEAGIVGAFAFWGWHVGVGWTRVLIAVLAPLIGFGVWGAVDFRWARRGAEAFRLTEELLICGLAVVALWGSGAWRWAFALALISIGQHVLVYAIGERLLKRS